MRAGQTEAAVDLARLAGWQYHCHHTDRSAQGALLWLHGATERRG